LGSFSGQVKGKGDDGAKAQVSCVNIIKEEHVSSPYMSDNVHRLWDLDTLGIREEDEVHEALKKAISFNGNRYQVHLLRKEGHEPLPLNYNNSLKRLKNQISKLKRDPDILEEYNQVISSQLEAGIIEPVVELEKAEKIHYLPHHAVVRKQAKTTKVRVVYDASCREGKNSVSLNDCLHVGPPLTPLLFEILLRFRENRVALAADIEKAFLNVEIAKTDRDVLRFLWVDDLGSDKIMPVVYRFCHVGFGVNYSPLLLNATLRYHLDSYAFNKPEFVQKLKDSFYVDDLISGEQSDKKTVELYRDAKQTLLAGGFRLCKWLTNSDTVRKAIQAHKSEDKVETGEKVR
jgi:hypothetical protein